jgi:hypothetical protein
MSCPLAVSSPHVKEADMYRRPPSSPQGLLVHPLSYIRHERNWTYQDLVDRIAARINTANRREKAWRWEHWGVEPDLDTQYALASELGVAAELVGSLGWPGWLPVGERIDIDTPWTVEGGLALLDNVAGDAVLDRRGFLILGLGVATTVASEWLAIEPPEVVSVLRGGRVGDALVSCFEQRLPALRQMDHTLGGGQVRGLVDSELRLLTDLLAQGSFTESVGRRMYSVAAELGRLAGWVSFDAGLHAAAERYWIAALRAAHIAQDRGIGANVLKCMSLQCLDVGRDDEAMSLAQTAHAGATDCPPRVMAMLTLRLARMHAIRGESAECEKLMSQADRQMTQADDQPAPSWATWFDRAEYCAQVAACYQVLNQHTTSDRWLEQALALQPDERSRDRATYLIWRADNQYHLGDVEHACALVKQAVPDIATARSARNQRRLTEIHSTLMKHRKVAAVQSLDEQVRTLIA